MLIVSTTEAARGLLAFGLLTAATTAGLMWLSQASRQTVRRLRLAAVGQVLVAVIWAVEDTPFEWHIIWTVTNSHGLTAGDLVGVAPLITGVLLLRASFRSQGRHREP